MTITRINEFRAVEGQGEALGDLIGSFVPIIEASDSCHSCQLLRSQEDATKIVVIELWDRVESHQASVKNIPPETLEEAKKLLAGPPTGGYYCTVTGPREG